MEWDSKLKDFFVSNEDTKVAVCNLCNKNVSFENSIVNLVHHLALTHQESLVNTFPIVISNDEELPDNVSSPIIMTCESWSFFETVEGSTMATCTLCQQVISFKTSRSNLEQHLKLEHGEIYKNFILSKSASTKNTTLNGANDVVTEVVVNSEEHVVPSDEHYIIISSSQDNTARKNSSAIWKIFEKIQNTKKAICTICQKKMSYRSTTANLKSHIRRLHPVIYHKQFNESKTSLHNSSEEESGPEENYSEEGNHMDNLLEDNVLSSSKEQIVRNNIWKIFKKIQNTQTATCSVCNVNMSFESTTGNLKRHIIRKHPNLYHKYFVSSKLETLNNNSNEDSGSEGNNSDYSVHSENNSENEHLLEDYMLNSSKVKRKNESCLWKFYRRIQHTKMATCTLCKKEISFKSTTSNLRIHLKRKHPAIFIKNFSKSESHPLSSSEEENFSEGNNSKTDSSIKKVPLNINSDVWQFFNKIKNTKTAACKFCQRNMSYKSTTANLRSHVKRIHPEICPKQFFVSKSVHTPSNVQIEGNSDEESLQLENISGDKHLLYNSADIPRKNRSILWNYFSKIHNTNMATCSLCQRNMSYKTSISNLKSHLRCIHPEKYRSLKLASCVSEELNESDINSSEDEHINNDNNLVIKPQAEHLHENNTFHTPNIYKNNITSFKEGNSDQYKNDYKIQDSQTFYLENMRKSNVCDSSNKSKRQNSPIWNFFDRNDSTKISRCKLCKIPISYKSTTAHLKQHFRLKHKSCYDDLMSKSTPNNIYEVYISTGEEQGQEDSENQGTIFNYGVDMDNKPINSQTDPFDSDENMISEPPKKVQKIDSNWTHKIQLDEKKNIDRCLIKLITEDFQPFNIVENRGFREFVAVLNPNYQLPTQKNLSTLLEEEYISKLAEYKSITNRCSSISLTLDCWSSRNMQCFMTVTAHFIDQNTFDFCSVLLQCAALHDLHTAEKIATELHHLTCDWDITNKVKFVVSDSVSNMVSAAQILKWPHFTCYARKFNLILQEALNDHPIAEIISKVQKMMAYFKNSSVAKKMLHEYQTKNLNIAQPKGPLLPIPTCWTTVCTMLKRCSELQEAICVTILNIDEKVLEITPEDWQCIDQLVEVLKPFEDAATLMSSEKYLIAGKAVVLTAGLYKVCEDVAGRQFCEVVTNLILKLKSGLHIHFGDIEKNEEISVCTLLDPRFKQHAFEDQAALLKAKECVLQKLKQLNMDNKIEANSLTDISKPDSSLLGQFYSKIASSYQPEMAEYKTLDELNRYLSENVIPPTECSLRWWKERRMLYPVLSKIFVACSNIVVTSLSCERAFSKTGYMLSDRLAQLTTSMVDKIIFLNVNK